MSKKLLFLTTHNLATNPRLVKEIDLAIQNQYQVQVICFEFNNWSKKINDELLLRFKSAEFIVLPAGRKPFLTWVLSFIKECAYRFLSKKITLDLTKISHAVSRRSSLLINAINNVEHADLVIGHNPGALYPTIVAAKKFSCPSGFDVEDYHPGEGQDKHLNSITLTLMKTLLPKFNYVSFASNLFQKKIEFVLGEVNKNWFSILNYSSSSEFIYPKELNDTTIKFVWFSQNINSGRGLENILFLFQKETYDIELHLYGSLDLRFYEEVLSKYNKIIIHQPLSQLELHKALSNYDIGLALDIANDENRDLAITNKILAYLQSGLYIIATDISAHQYIINQHQNHGVYFSNLNISANNLLQNIKSEISLIRKYKVDRYMRFKKYSWENESMLLQKKWTKLLH